MKGLLLSLALLLVSIDGVSAQEPVRIAVAGLSHGHVSWILQRPDRGDIRIVGIYEPDRELAERYAERYDIRPELLFDDLGEMLDVVKPEAVTAFGPTSDHLAVVRAAAPRGIHVMVEKPLATTVEDAVAIEALARKHNVHVLTNYETTWYASNHQAYEVIHDDRLVGPIRKLVVHDGHRGPQEIGVGPEFLEWLTDPVRNGAGALFDFGCYGANLITWLMDGAAPLTVTAVTQQLKPEIYPHVDDEATIILTYPGAQGIVQASWNWPISRKDMQVYGQTGYVYAPDANTLLLREGEGQPARTLALEPRGTPFNDPFAYLAAVVRGRIEVSEKDLSSLTNNVLVVRILDAARHSAETGETVRLATRSTP